MTDDVGESKPKRTAMQIAVDAERAATELRDEIENIGALAAAAAESGGSAPVGSVLAELRDKIGEFEDWRAGFLGADGPKGVSKIAEDIQAVKDGTAGMTTALSDAVRELRADVENLRTQLNESVVPAASEGPLRQRAPHVLGLIAQLQRRVHEISKGREFKAENQRGQVTQQYSFRGIDEAQNAIGSAQREIGLIGPKVTIVEKSVSVTEVDKGSYTQVWTTVSVTARYTFQSPIDGSEWSTEGCGMGRDLGDKAESKALAGAFKYALFHGLNIPVKGVFVDAETEDPRIEREQTQPGRFDGDGRSHGHGQPPGGWRVDDGRDRPRDVDELDRSPIDPPGEVQAAADAVRRDERPPAEQATAALRAARVANLNDMVNIWRRAQQLGILSMHVEGAQLGQHLIATLNTQPGGREIDLPGMEHYR